MFEITMGKEHASFTSSTHKSSNNGPGDNISLEKRRHLLIHTLAVGFQAQATKNCAGHDADGKTCTVG